MSDQCSPFPQPLSTLSSVLYANVSRHKVESHLRFSLFSRRLILNETVSQIGFSFGKKISKSVFSLGPLTSFLLSCFVFPGIGKIYVESTSMKMLTNR